VSGRLSRGIFVFRATLLALVCSCSSEQEATPQRMGQFPSPMADRVRVHGRVEKKDVPGVSFALDNVLAKPVDLYLADRTREANAVDLVVHFHGASYVARHAVCASGRPLVLAVVNLGSGSGVYERAFAEGATFARLVDDVRDAVAERTSRDVVVSRVYLSSFSAGYGAVRAILRDHSLLIDGIILLDGLHTDYVPPRRVLAQGGTLNTEKLKGFVQYARLAAEGKKKLLITHSAIFPGTYASTTETADYLIATLDLGRQPVLKWGPVGMQLLSETRKQGLTILAFAGNTAPDHIDHLHGLRLESVHLPNR